MARVSTIRIRLARGLAGVCPALASSLLLAAGAHANAWAPQSSPTTVKLLGASCASTKVCGAVGALSGGEGEIAFTSNGTSWTGAAGLGGEQLNAISCADATHCWAVGNGGVILFSNTTTTLTQETSPTAVNLNGLDCPSNTTCFAVGVKSAGNGVIAVTTDAGAKWTTETSAGGQVLNAIACSSTTSCWAVGAGGLILHTANGTSWSTETSTTTESLTAISCASASDCWAVGAKGSEGLVLASTNGGTTWAAQTQTAGKPLNAIACPDTTHCWAVGNAGVVIRTTNGGAGWSAQSSETAKALYAVAFSGDTVGWAAGAEGEIDGYGCRFGSLSLTPPASIAFPSTTLDGLNQTIDANFPVTVDDETGSGAGWNLTATSTTFTAGAKTLPTSAAEIEAVGQNASTTDCSPASDAIGYPVTVPAATTAPAGVKIFNAAASSGAGPASLTVYASLAIPARAASGSYSSTWTLTLASGP
jgi:photosystem II stability/assembly factor-like uncharacterized protein